MTGRLSINWLKALISVSAMGVIIIRITCPELKIDAISFGLIVVAVLPWLSELIDTAKFPGGWEIKFRDIRAAAAQVTSSSESSAASTSSSSSSSDSSQASETPGFLAVADRDPNLALVGLRIEIEKRLRDYCQRHGLDDSRPLSHLLADLGQRSVLPFEMVAGLRRLINAGNAAAHGARVQEGISEWALGVWPEILKALDEQLR